MAAGRIAAIIPAWNEADSLGTLLDELRSLPTQVLDEIVVVDKHSTDGTADVARAAGAVVVTQQRGGYGGACWEGFQAARTRGATMVVFLDADGSDPPSAIPALLAQVATGDADLALGVRRAAGGAPDPIPWHARAGNALVRSVLHWRTGRGVSDLPSLKAIGVETLCSLDMQEMGYGWTTELIAKALRRGFRLCEIPVAVRPRTAGISKVSGNLAASLQAGAALIGTSWRATR